MFNAIAHYVAMSVVYYLEETYQNLKHHKLRSVLTGLGVTWGIFILVILLGAGEGFANGVMKRFSGFARNVITCYSGYTPERGWIQFKVSWLNQLRHNVGIQYITPLSYNTCDISHRGKHQKKQVVSADVCYHKIAQLELKKGRFLNSQDAIYARPVCVIGDRIKNTFFKEEDPIGKFIEVRGTYLQVVGVLDKDAPLNSKDQDHVLIPFQTFARLYNPDILNMCYEFKILLHPRADSKRTEKEVRAYLNEHLQLTDSDTDAIRIWNVNAIVNLHHKLFRNIRLFLWVIGIFILLNGILGISNMMLVAVHERTQELGIRKVLGASARETRIMVLTEAICISLISGMVGMVAGMGVIHVLNGILDYMHHGPNVMMDHLVFRLPVALAALFLLVIAGAIAGIVPAKRAMAILPIQALNTE